jgi:dipeptidyl aminopeptidase/acylaminoacyl peptidase
MRNEGGERTRVLARLVVILSLLAACVSGAEAVPPTPSGSFVLRLERSQGARGSWLEITDLAGGNRRVLTPIPSLKTRRYDTKATLSPDGTKVAFIRMGRRGGNVLYVVNADGSDLHIVAGPDQVGQGINRVDWSPQGDELAFEREAADENHCPIMRSQLGIYVVRSDGTGLYQLPVVPSGLPPTRQHPLTLDLRGWSPDSQHVLYEADTWNAGDCFRADLYLGSSTLYEIGRDGTNLAKILSLSGYGTAEAAFSPNGDSLASVDPESCDLLIRSTARGESGRFRRARWRGVITAVDSPSRGFPLGARSCSPIVFTSA